MRLYSQNSLLQEIRRHIPAKLFSFCSKYIEPYVLVYKTESANANQFRCYDEETYNEVVNTAIRARKANPTDIEKAEADFCTLVKAISRPGVVTLYTLSDVAKAAGPNDTSIYAYLVSIENPPYDYLETDNGRRVRFLDRDNYLKAIEFAQKTGPKERFKQKDEPKKEPAAAQNMQQLFETRYASSQYVHECIKERFSLGSRAQCRAFVNRLLDFLPHYIFVRGMNTEVLFDLAVADKFNEAAKASESIADLTRKLVALFAEAPKKKLYSLTEIAEMLGVPRNDHDREEVRMLAASLSIGGALASDQPTIFFTEEEKDAIIKAHKGKKAAPVDVQSPKAESGSVSVCVNGITISLSRADALKLAQSIINQIGG